MSDIEELRRGGASPAVVHVKDAADDTVPLDEHDRQMAALREQCARETDEVGCWSVYSLMRDIIISVELGNTHLDIEPFLNKLLPNRV